MWEPTLKLLLVRQQYSVSQLLYSRFSEDVLTCFWFAASPSGPWDPRARFSSLPFCSNVPKLAFPQIPWFLSPLPKMFCFNVRHFFKLPLLKYMPPFAKSLTTQTPLQCIRRWPWLSHLTAAVKLRARPTIETNMLASVLDIYRNVLAGEPRKWATE